MRTTLSTVVFATKIVIHYKGLAAPSLCFSVFKLFLTFFCWNYKARSSFFFFFFYISFVQSSGQWQQCICQRHIGSASWITIVLWHKTNGTVGISVVFILVNDRSIKVVLCDWGKLQSCAFSFSMSFKVQKALHGLFWCRVAFSNNILGLKLSILDIRAFIHS